MSSSNSPIWRLVSSQGQDIVAINVSDRRPAFYCIHSVAGDVTGYFELARLLGPQIPFYGIQVAKRNMVAQAVTSIEKLGERYADALAGFQPEGPFIIGGFSAGAIIALEVAQQLVKRGREVSLLVALDGAPSNVDAGIKSWTPSYIWQLCINMARILVELRFDVRSVVTLPARIVDRLVCRSGTRIPLLRSSKTLDMAAMLHVFARPGWQLEYKLFLRAMYEAMYAYVPRTYGGRVIAYELQRQPVLHLRQLGAVWRKLAVDCEIVSLKGRHGEFFREATLEPLVQHLRAALLAEQCQSKSLYA